MDLLAVISSYLPSLSKSEKKVAQFILSNPDEIEKLSINEISTVVGVGESTIVRFARKIGLGGFQELKLSLARSQALMTEKIAGKENEEEYLVFKQYQESLEETKNFLNADVIQETTKKIHEAKRIFIFAVGKSGLTGMELSDRLKRLGKTVEFVTDGQLQSIYATTMQTGDVAFAISTSGNTEEIIANVKMAKENGCFVISMTNYIGSKVAKISDVCLLASSKEFISDAGSFATTVNQLFLIDVLTQELVNLDPSHYHKLRMKRNQALMNRLN
ncbi:MAG TPA: MurR/RpiR family transcriptional regulator [Candidatus Tetragenococcus pullicola]|nr:MurR/RpiR family transcriptional regulator [Candidatus Tetragenococcus pullicola]